MSIRRGTVPKTTFFEVVASLAADRRFEWQATTECLCCGRSFVVRRGEPAAVVRAGNETIGIVCALCLDPSTARILDELLRRRAAADGGDGVVREMRTR